jgi:hypothetical protein
MSKTEREFRKYAEWFNSLYKNVILEEKEH